MGRIVINKLNATVVQNRMDCGDIEEKTNREIYHQIMQLSLEEVFCLDIDRQHFLVGYLCAKEYIYI